MATCIFAVVDKWKDTAASEGFFLSSVELRVEFDFSHSQLDFSYLQLNFTYLQLEFYNLQIDFSNAQLDFSYSQLDFTSFPTS